MKAKMVKQTKEYSKKNYGALLYLESVTIRD